MPTDDDLFIPPSAQKLADRLTRDTGVAPTVRKYVTGYMLEHANENVRMTMHFKKRGGKWGWAGSTLTVGGERQPTLARDYNDYVDIFNLGRRRGLLERYETVEAPVIGEVVPQIEAPSEVVQHWGTIISSLPPNTRSNAAISAHRTEDGYVLVCRVLALSIYTFFSKSGSAHPMSKILVTFPDPDTEKLLDITDRFVELTGDLQSLIAELTDSEPVAEIPSKIHHTSDPKRLNSVEVRRTTVIRV